MTTHKAQFSWPNTHPNTVIITGSFDNWSGNTHHLTKTEHGFEGTIDLEWGRDYEYKYVVDGNWQIRDDQDKEWDSAGNLNNRYRVPLKPVEPVATAAPVFANDKDVSSTKPVGAAAGVLVPEGSGAAPSETTPSVPIDSKRGILDEPSTHSSVAPSLLSSQTPGPAAGIITPSASAASTKSVKDADLVSSGPSAAAVDTPAEAYPSDVTPAEAVKKEAAKKEAVAEPVLDSEVVNPAPLLSRPIAVESTSSPKSAQEALAPITGETNVTTTTSGTEDEGLVPRSTAAIASAAAAVTAGIGGFVALATGDHKDTTTNPAASAEETQTKDIVPATAITPAHTSTTGEAAPATAFSAPLKDALAPITGFGAKGDGFATETTNVGENLTTQTQGLADTAASAGQDLASSATAAIAGAGAAVAAGLGGITALATGEQKTPVAAVDVEQTPAEQKRDIDTNLASGVPSQGIDPATSAKAGSFADSAPALTAITGKSLSDSASAAVAGTAAALTAGVGSVAALATGKDAAAGVAKTPEEQKRAIDANAASGVPSQGIDPATAATPASIAGVPSSATSPSSVTASSAPLKDALAPITGLGAKGNGFATEAANAGKNITDTASAAVAGTTAAVTAASAGAAAIVTGNKTAEGAETTLHIAPAKLAADPTPAPAVPASTPATTPGPVAATESASATTPKASNQTLFPISSGTDDFSSGATAAIAGAAAAVTAGVGGLAAFTKGKKSQLEKLSEDQTRALQDIHTDVSAKATPISEKLDQFAVESSGGLPPAGLSNVPSTTSATKPGFVSNIRQLSQTSGLPSINPPKTDDVGTDSVIHTGSNDSAAGAAFSASGVPVALGAAVKIGSGDYSRDGRKVESVAAPAPSETSTAVVDDASTTSHPDNFQHVDKSTVPSTTTATPSVTTASAVPTSTATTTATPVAAGVAGATLAPSSRENAAPSVPAKDTPATTADAGAIPSTPKKATDNSVPGAYPSSVVSSSATSTPVGKSDHQNIHGGETGSEHGDKLRKRKSSFFASVSRIFGKKDKEREASSASNK